MRRALLLALLLLVPLAAADHIYSHRVYVVGRVLDVEGRPAAGVPLDLSFEGMSAGGGCFDQKREVTGPRGDYEVCRHAHELPERANVTVRAGNVSRTVGVDQNLRLAVASLQLDTTSIHDVSGERQFARSFDVVGRAFALQRTSTVEEGVRVNATPLFENATVTLLFENETLARAEVTPDEYGIYRAQLAVEEVPVGSLARVRVGRESVQVLADPVFRRADVSVVRDLRLVGGPGDDAPGSTATPLPLWLVLMALSATAWRARRCRR